MVETAQGLSAEAESNGTTFGATFWHAVLQLPHQLHVYRLQLLWDANSSIFPKGFAREAVEVGPTDGQDGPCLLLFTFVSLSPPEFTEWLERTCYDWVVLRIYWLPAAAPATPAVAAAGGAAVRPYAIYTGQEALREAVRATPVPASPGGGCGVRLQVYPRTEEPAMAELLRDTVTLDLDMPQYVLSVVQWPSESVAAAAAALAACDADHMRLARGHDKQQRASRRLASELQAIADGLATAGEVGLTEAEMAALAEAALAEAEAAVEPPAGQQEGACAADARGAGQGEREEVTGRGEEQNGGKCRGLGGSSGDGAGGRRNDAGREEQEENSEKKKAEGAGRAAGGAAGAVANPVPVLKAVAAIPDPTQRWRAATARASLERRRLAERDVRRAAVVARCEEERAGLAAALAAAQGVAEYSFGLLPAASAYCYGNEREKKMPGQLCRAASKLREALLTCTGSARLPPGLAAVDVGAAPGGWSALLAASGARLVLAIDPAEMDPALLAAHPTTLRHLRCKCEAAVASGALAAALAEAGLAAVDLLVCDVNAHPGDAFAMLRPVLPLLRPGGLLVLTLKTFGRGRDKEAFGAELAAALGEGWEPGRLVWLLSNTLCERTFVARRRKMAPEAPEALEVKTARDGF